jgi:hypothetical protein
VDMCRSLRDTTLKLGLGQDSLSAERARIDKNAHLRDRICGKDHRCGDGEDLHAHFARV